MEWGNESPCHMTKMAAMPIYGKNLKKSFSPEPKGRWPWNLVQCMQHWVFEYYQICSNYDSGLTLTYFTPRSNLVPFAFVWENMKPAMDFSKTYCRLWFDSSNRWPKWQKVSIDIKTLSPGGCMPPTPGLCIEDLKRVVISYEIYETSLRRVS